MDLENRVAIVSGGARGIGLAIAEDLSAHGASVVIVDSGVSISGQPQEPALAETIVKGRDRWAAVCGDVAESSTARAAVDTAHKRFGAVDIVVTRVVAHDLARSAIRCNAVTPFAATRVTESIKPANDAQAAYKQKALQVPALYVARLVSFLASGAAAKISGQLFGARGRELFVFSQSRPLARLLQQQGGSELTALTEQMKALEPH